MTTFFHRGQLIFEVHPGGAGIYHGLHQLIGVQHATESSFGIGHNRQEVIDITLIFRVFTLVPLDLIGAAEGVIDPPHHGRHRVGRIE